MRGTSAIVSPVEGSTTGNVSPESDSSSRSGTSTVALTLDSLRTRHRPSSAAAISAQVPTEATFCIA